MPACPSGNRQNRQPVVSISCLSGSDAWHRRAGARHRRANDSAAASPGLGCPGTTNPDKATPCFDQNLRRVLIRAHPRATAAGLMDINDNARCAGKQFRSRKIDKMDSLLGRLVAKTRILPQASWHSAGRITIRIRKRRPSPQPSPTKAREKPERRSAYVGSSCSVALRHL